MAPRATGEAGDSLEHGSTDSRTQSVDSVEHGDPTVTVTLGRHDDGFYVEDDGPGIPPDHRESVFEYEYTTAGGTGLGLAIVAAIAEAHGWRTTAAEGSDGGARIVFSDVSLTDDAADAGTRPDSDANAPEVEM
jgi:signal transduction histidine kinase